MKRCTAFGPNEKPKHLVFVYVSVDCPNIMSNRAELIISKKMIKMIWMNTGKMEEIIASSERIEIVNDFTYMDSIVLAERKNVILLLG